MWPWPWPMTLIFNSILAVVIVHVRTKFHRAKCSGSWIIVVTVKKERKKLRHDAENNTVVATADSNNFYHLVVCRLKPLNYWNSWRFVGEVETCTLWLCVCVFSINWYSIKSIKAVEPRTASRHHTLHGIQGRLFPQCIIANACLYHSAHLYVNTKVKLFPITLHPRPSFTFLFVNLFSAVVSWVSAGKLINIKKLNQKKMPRLKQHPRQNLSKTLLWNSLVEVFIYFISHSVSL